MQQPNAKPQANAQLVFYIMLFSAAMIAVLATVLPGLLELDDELTLVLRGAFFVAALGDVIIAFYLRGKLRKLAPTDKGGGTVQRQ